MIWGGKREEGERRGWGRGRRGEEGEEEKRTENMGERGITRSMRGPATKGFY